MRLWTLILFFLLVPAAAQETTVWIGPAENITKQTVGLSELEMTIEGTTVTGYWRFLPNVEFVIEEGHYKDGVATWWHRNIEGRSFHIKLHIAPDGQTALCDYFGRYPDPKDDTRGYVRYSLVQGSI
jgi:hypothetical protein